MPALDEAVIDPARSVVRPARRPVRLTRRGRIVLAVLLLAVVTAALVLIAPNGEIYAGQQLLVPPAG